jgi:hypothetical protein
LLAEVWLFNLKQQVIFVDLACLSGRDVLVGSQVIRPILPCYPDLVLNNELWPAHQTSFKVVIPISTYAFEKSENSALPSSNNSAGYFFHIENSSHK